MMDWLNENLSVSDSDVWEKEIWPPRSSACRPLDYFVCDISKFRVSVKLHNKIAYLIPKIMEVMEFLDSDTVAKAFRRFRSRSEAVVAADVHFIE
jgi:hypothetical protein